MIRRIGNMLVATAGGGPESQGARGDQTQNVNQPNAGLAGTWMVKGTVEVVLPSGNYEVSVEGGEYTLATAVTDESILQDTMVWMAKSSDTGQWIILGSVKGLG